MEMLFYMQNFTQLQKKEIYFMLHIPCS